MKTIALYSIKGGVGKTAAAVNLAYLAAETGAKVLLCDLDPQGSASFYFRVRPKRKFKSKTLLAGGRKVDRSIRGTDFDNLDSLPSCLSYRNLDRALDNGSGRRKTLRKTLRSLPEEYDYVFLDCPPNVTRVAENAFAAADTVLVPVVPTTLSLRTYDLLDRFFDRRRFGRARILGFFSMVESRKKMHQEIMAELSLRDGEFLKTVVPYSAVVEKMGIHRQPVPCFQPRAQAASAYRDLWGEVEAANRR